MPTEFKKMPLNVVFVALMVVASISRLPLAPVEPTPCTAFNVTALAMMSAVESLPASVICDVAPVAVSDTVLAVSIFASDILPIFVLAGVGFLVKSSIGHAEHYKMVDELLASEPTSWTGHEMKVHGYVYPGSIVEKVTGQEIPYAP